MPTTRATRATIATHWPDIIPAIPLARSVPVIIVSGRGKGTRWIVAQLDTERGRDKGYPLLTHEEGATDRFRLHQIRIDLDDPQGFAYALRWLLRSGRLDDEQKRRSLFLLNLSAQQDVTDADRVALARALAEVAR